jgi:hypothetical protein
MRGKKKQELKKNLLLKNSQVEKKINLQVENNKYILQGIPLLPKKQKQQNQQKKVKISLIELQAYQ